MPNIPAQALFNACVDGDAAAVNRLLPARGTSLDLSGPHFQHPDDQSTPLIAAALYGHTGIVWMILERAPSNSLDYVGAHGATALRLAARYHHVDIVRLLADCGANVNRAGHRGSTPSTKRARLRSASPAGSAMPKSPSPSWTPAQPSTTPRHSATDTPASRRSCSPRKRTTPASPSCSSIEAPTAPRRPPGQHTETTRVPPRSTSCAVAPTATQSLRRRSRCCACGAAACAGSRHQACRR